MNKLVPRVGVASLASPMEVGADRAPRVLADLAALLRDRGIEVVPSERPVTAPDSAASTGRMFAEQHVDVLCLAAASWFEDYLVLDMLEEAGVPVFLWAFPGMETGALCGTQQIACYLKQLAKPCASVFGPLEPGPNLNRAFSFLRAAALRNRLRRARIGLAGYRTPGMTEIAANEIALKRVLGPRVVPVDMVHLLEAARKWDNTERGRIWSRVKAAAGRVDVLDAAGLDAAGIYLALRETVQREGLSALAFGCYPYFMGRACLAASLLADEGIPISCEGDVNGAVGMLILSLLSGHPTHNTDLLETLPDGSIVFSHCGSSSHAFAESREDITIAPVRLAHAGVCSLFPARPGPVTLINLIPSGTAYQLAVMEGEAIGAEMVFPGNPLCVRFRHTAQEIYNWVCVEGIAHHWMAAYGYFAAELSDLARIIGPELKYLTM